MAHRRHALPVAHRHHARPLSSLLRLNARTFAVLCPARFCGHPAFTPCPVLWTPRFLLSVHFCGHRAFTACPVLWTPCYLLSVHFCGHRAIYCLSGFADVFHSRNAKFQNIGIFNDAILCVNNGLLPNILVFTLNFSLCSRCKIPVYWNFYSVSLGTILCCFNSRVKWYLTWVVIAYCFNRRVSYYLTWVLFEHYQKHCEDVMSQNLYRYFNAVKGWSVPRSRVSYYLTCLFFEYKLPPLQGVKLWLSATVTAMRLRVQRLAAATRSRLVAATLPVARCCRYKLSKSSGSPRKASICSLVSCLAFLNRFSSLTKRDLFHLRSAEGISVTRRPLENSQPCDL